MIAEAVSPAALAHVSNHFAFDLTVPVAQAAPMFGPTGERAWAGPHWTPSFLYPASGHDVEGAVFTVPHGPVTSVWVNTLFDLAGGRMQYVCLLPDVMAASIDVRLTPAPAGSHVEVTYTRTALRAESNATVEAMGEKDRGSGPEWQAAISRALGTVLP